jgi:regulator of protease activity HflC (stomatin/prohibitin superfamily)
MPNNRATINDFDILRPAETLSKGIPLPGLDGRFEVGEGWVAIVTEGGAFKEILGPGTHFVSKYHFWRNIRQTQVNTKINRLPVISTREFAIGEPSAVEVNVELSVEYRVTDPRRVAMEMSAPLTSLWDRVHSSVGNVVAMCTHDELRTRGEGVARVVMQRLQGMQLPVTLGIEIFNVFVTALKPTDAGSDALAKLQFKEFEQRRAWQTQNEMLSQSQITPQWLLINQPEIYKQILAGNTEVLKAYIEHQGGDPARILQQFATGAPFDLPGMGPPGMQMPFGGNGQPAVGSGFTPPRLGAGSPSSTGPDALARIREEVELLRKIPGASVEARAGQVDGLPDGTYGVEARVPRPAGGMLTLRFDCSAQFPSTAPMLEVMLDDQPSAFNSVVARQWGTHRYLVEIVNEARQYFG